MATPAWTVDKPFHVVYHHVEAKNKSGRVLTSCSLYVKNRPLFKKRFPFPRDEARRVVASLNRSARCRVWAKGIKFSKKGVV